MNAIRKRKEKIKKGDGNEKMACEKRRKRERSVGDTSGEVVRREGTRVKKTDMETKDRIYFGEK